MKLDDPKHEIIDSVKNSPWLGVRAKITPVCAIRGPRVKRFTAWALSDWMNWGEAKYGQTYTQAVDATGFQPDYLRILKYVRASVDPCRRRESLSFSHHRLIAPLEPDDQERFLSEADKKVWSCQELRRAIFEFKNLPQNGHSNRGQKNTVAEAADDSAVVLSSHEAELADSLRCAFDRWPVDDRARFFETAEMALRDLRSGVVSQA
jgi:hypothetical protein